MPLSIPNIKFELGNVYKTYVEQILLSSSISNILLDSTNIDSAGEQIEGSLRILLKNLLPERVTVSHGYIVDKSSKISYQQDILLTESFYTKSLIRSLDGTEFYPYEAIFSCGEVKKTWSQGKLETSIKSIKRNKSELSRFLIPSDVMATGSNFIKVSEVLTINKHRNPLFCFTFSIDFDKTYNDKKLNAIYNNPSNQTLLPNISVILNQGIIVCVDKEKISKGEISIKLYPEFNTNNDCCWVFLKLKPEQNLAYLIFMLSQHVNDTILEKVSAMEYGQNMITISQSSIQPLI
jgi:hypothetical protein